MKKKLVSCLLISAMTASLAAGSVCAEEDTSSVLKDGKMDKITMVFPGNNSAPASLSAVNAALTEIAQETIDCEVEIKIMEWGVYSEQLNLQLSSGEDIDICFTLGNVKTAATSGQVLDITELAPVYAPDIMESMGQYVEGCYMGGSLYGFPSFHEFASRSGLVCRTDILDEMGVDPASITTWDDVSSLLAQVHENYPDLDVLVPANVGSGMLDSYLLGEFDTLLTSMVVVYADGSQGTTAYSMYDTPEFEEVAQLAYEWNQAGYFIADSTTITDTRQTYLKAGSCFGYVGTIHPGTKTQESINAGVDITTIPINTPAAGTSNIATFEYCIPSGSGSPEKALAFLNLVYSNADVQNLLKYGIEGTDYVVNEDGQATYPDGVDSETVGWTNETWLTGNATLSYPWVTDPVDIWEQYEEYNSGANYSPAYGFSYDYSGVKNEYTAVSNVLNKYTATIYSGMADPEETLTAFREELEAAGMSVIVADVQSQLDAWSANQ